MPTSRAVLVVDTGFLIKGLLIHQGCHRREDLDIDWDGLSHELAALAAEHTHSDVVRTTWYDAAVGGQPRDEHLALRAIPGVQVRLGWTARTRGGVKQKAVDTRIVRDMVLWAVSGGFSDVVLVSGDGDLVPGVEDLVDHGIVVHLWGLSTEDDRLRQSAELVALADRRRVLTVEDLARHAPIHEPQVPTPGTQVSPGEDDVADELASAADVLDVPPAQPATRIPLGLPLLAHLSTEEERAADAGEDAADPPSPWEVGARYARRWWERADDGDRQRCRRPSQFDVPYSLDRDLLGRLSAQGHDSYDEGVKIEARAGFKEALAQIGGESDSARTVEAPEHT